MEPVEATPTLLGCGSSNPHSRVMFRISEPLLPSQIKAPCGRALAGGVCYQEGSDLARSGCATGGIHVEHRISGSRKTRTLDMPVGFSGLSQETGGTEMLYYDRKDPNGVLNPGNVLADAVQTKETPSGALRRN